MGQIFPKRYQSLTENLEENTRRNQKAFEKDKAFIQQKNN